MFWNRNPKQEEEVLRPGRCECTHIRSAHEKGKDACHAWHPPTDDFPSGGKCACQVFIRDDDDGGDDPDPEIPSPSELETLYQRC